MRLSVTDSSQIDTVRYVLRATPVGEFTTRPPRPSSHPANLAKIANILYIADRVLAIYFSEETNSD
jgi:hypothetical protein